MIDTDTAKHILAKTSRLWEERVQTESFLELTRGNERGHRIADFVGDVTTSLLRAEFDTRFQGSAQGRKRQRSMGDIWLHSQGIYNPINVKTGEYGKNGQPNIVSLKKLLRALLADHIDSYYLLIVKFSLNDPPTCHSYFVDLLDCLAFATFDSGPGQMMLKEREFYPAMDAGRQQQNGAPLTEKIEALFNLLEDGEQRLIRNRASGLEQLRRLIEQYRQRPDHTFNQESLHLIP